MESLQPGMVSGFFSLTVVYVICVVEVYEKKTHLCFSHRKVQAELQCSPTFDI